MLWRARVWRGRRCRVPRMRLGSRRRMATLGCPLRAWRSPRAAPASRAPRVARSRVSPPPRRVGVARLPPREPPPLSAARFPPERRGDLPVRRGPSDAPDRHPPRRRCGRPGPTPRACPPCAKAPGPCTGTTGYANTSCGVWAGEGRVRGGGSSGRGEATIFFRRWRSERTLSGGSEARGTGPRTRGTAPPCAYVPPGPSRPPRTPSRPTWSSRASPGTGPRAKNYDVRANGRESIGHGYGSRGGAASA